MESIFRLFFLRENPSEMDKCGKLPSINIVIVKYLSRANLTSHNLLTGPSKASYLPHPALLKSEGNGLKTESLTSRYQFQEC